MLPSTHAPPSSSDREKVAPACHNVTDFPRWFKAQASDPPYSVMYKAEFEPWFISGRRQTQWFDVRFRGYGKNKVRCRMRTRLGIVIFIHALAHPRSVRSSPNEPNGNKTRTLMPPLPSPSFALQIVQVAATAAAGSPFLVHPSGFLVHRQHTESASRKAFLKVRTSHTEPRVGDRGDGGTLLDGPM